MTLAHSPLHVGTPRIWALSACGLWLLSACAAKEHPDRSGQIEESKKPLYVAGSRLWPEGPIPVCWESVDPAEETERGWVRAAVEKTWQGVSAVRFSGWGLCKATDKGMRLRAKDVGPYTLGLGTEIDGVKDGMVLNFVFSSWSPGCQRTREYCVTVGAVHEFGHALGFAHEQNREDTPSWCTSEQGSDGDITVGSWDLDSVMNYCNPLWTGDGKLSSTDKEGIRASYGRGGTAWELARSTGSTFQAALDSEDSASRGADDAAFVDVTGDGRADLVLWFAASRQLMVAQAESTDGRFSPLAPWLVGAGSAAARLLFSDVTGDGRVDAVFVSKTTGEWSVAVSTGSAFRVPVQWKTGHGIGSTNQLLGDVNGDGRSDAISFFSATGNWWTALSLGTSFSDYAQWKTGHGIGSTSQHLADVTGDGRADAIVFYDSGGKWWVAPSSGRAFSAYSLWRTGHSSGSSSQLVFDVTGDGKADAVGVFSKTGSFWVAPSSGGNFSADSRFGTGLGTAVISGLNQVLMGDGNADGKADVVIRWRR